MGAAEGALVLARSLVVYWCSRRHYLRNGFASRIILWNGLAAVGLGPIVADSEESAQVDDRTGYCLWVGDRTLAR